MKSVSFNNTMTLKCVTFISNSKLRQILTDTLSEIDDIAFIGAARSTVYLTMSTLEGVLSHLIEINETKAKALQDFPKKGGRQKKVSELNFDEKISVAKGLEFIEKEYYETLQKMRRLRNYMHPAAELRTVEDPIDLGTSQISLGILNHTLTNLKKFRFIKSNVWHVVSGDPIYELLADTIEFKHGKSRANKTNSFLYTKDFISKELSIAFNLTLSRDCLLNFVYNYESDSEFNMLRFDAREPNGNGILECRHYHEWGYLTHFLYELKTDSANRIDIGCSSNDFQLKINGKKVTIDGTYPKYDKQKPVGFFNEVSSLSIDKLRISELKISKTPNVKRKK